MFFVVLAGSDSDTYHTVAQQKVSEYETICGICLLFQAFQRECWRQFQLYSYIGPILLTFDASTL